MADIFSIIQSIVPEINDLLAERLAILRVLQQSDVRVGRKFIAQQTNLTERTVRSILEVLKQQSLVSVLRTGVSITAEGHEELELIDTFVLHQERHRYYEIEEALKRKLDIEHCLIVAGDADQDSVVFDRLGQAVQTVLNDFLPKGENVIAVTGGSTLFQVAQSFTKELSDDRSITFVPSRGGLGSSINIQSNSVGSLMAQQTESSYTPLFMPENLTKETSEMLLNDPAIKSIIEMSKQANCLLLSIGTADIMAQRREITEEQLEIIERGHAVGEAFGIFFDEKGETVLRYPRVGLKFKDLSNIPLLITIVGGSSKAEAVEAFFQRAPSHGWLICDEGLANMVLNGETL
ncbi:sugar-binding transcriptional regulator [Aerococcaceae bacterium WGS1372]